MPRISIVIPTLRRHSALTRALERLEGQRAPEDSFEVIVVADAAEEDVAGLDDAIGTRRYPLRRLTASVPGASAARNCGWRAGEAPLVLFLDDDVLAEPDLVGEHLGTHERHPEETVGVLGHVGWARELRVTPFMRWLDHGVQFDYPGIVGQEAGWGRFYTANASVKRGLVERVGGFDERLLPFGYEDLDLAYRMDRLGFRLLYNRRARAEHLHPMSLEGWLGGHVARIAASERRFVQKHPEVPPYFFNMFSRAANAPPARGRGARLARFVPARTPWLGPRVWASVDARFKQALAPAFLAAWHAAATTSQPEPSEAPSATHSGASSSGPK